MTAPTDNDRPLPGVGIGSISGERLPSGWATAPLEEICTFASGGTPPKSKPEFWGGHIPWASPKDLKVTKLRDTEDHISQPGLDVGSVLAPAHAVLVVVRGMILARDIPMALTEVPVAFNQDLKAVIPTDRVDAEYLLYAMLACKRSLFQKIGRSAHGTRTLLSNELAQFTVPVPPFGEQKRIAAVLSLVHRAIENEERVIITARELKRAALADVFTRGLRREPTRETQIGTLPESWDVVPLGRYLRRAQYGLSMRGQETGRYPILRMNCQDDGRVIFRDLQFVDVDNRTFEAFRLMEGDLLFNRTNSFELVGRTAVFHDERDAVFASYLIRLAVDLEQFNPDYLNQYLNWEVAQMELKKLASRGVSQANISASKLKDFPVPKPTLAAQNEIADALAKIDMRVQLAERHRIVLGELFSTLLDKFMTGEIRVDKLDIDRSAVVGA